MNLEPKRFRPKGSLVRYLTNTHPAVIFIHAVVLLLVGPFLNAAELWMQSSHGGYGDFLRMTLDGDDSGFFARSDDGPVNPFRSILIWVVRLAARVALTVGFALPVWAAARLIADTLAGRGSAADLKEAPTSATPIS